LALRRPGKGQDARTSRVGQVVADRLKTRTDSVATTAAHVVITRRLSSAPVVVPLSGLLEQGDRVHVNPSHGAGNTADDPQQS